jgi:hypothetical protein
MIDIAPSLALALVFCSASSVFVSGAEVQRLRATFSDVERCFDKVICERSLEWSARVGRRLHVDLFLPGPLVVVVHSAEESAVEMATNLASAGSVLAIAATTASLSIQAGSWSRRRRFSNRPTRGRSRRTSSSSCTR